MNDRRIRPDTRVADLAQHELLDQLNGAALVVYLRLVAASMKQGKKIHIRNIELVPTDKSGATVQRALRELKEMKLVTVKYNTGEDREKSRTVELL